MRNCLPPDPFLVREQLAPFVVTGAGWGRHRGEVNSLLAVPVPSGAVGSRQPAEMLRAALQTPVPR